MLDIVIKPKFVVQLGKSFLLVVKVLAIGPVPTPEGFNFLHGFNPHQDSFTGVFQLTRDFSLFEPLPDRAILLLHDVPPFLESFVSLHGFETAKFVLKPLSQARKRTRLEGSKRALKVGGLPEHTARQGGPWMLVVLLDASSDLADWEQLSTAVEDTMRGLESSELRDASRPTTTRVGLPLRLQMHQSFLVVVRHEGVGED